MPQLSILDRLLCSGLGSLFRVLPLGDSAGKLLILIFHRVLDEKDFMRPAEPDVEEFRWKMEMISRYFAVLPLKNALDQLAQGSLPARALSITFDDGYADNLLNAVPVLLELKLPATFYIATGFLEGGRMWNDTVIEACRNIDTPYLDLSKFGLGVFDLGSRNECYKSAQDILGKIKHLPIEQREEIAQYVGNTAGNLPDNLMLSHAQLRELARADMEIGGHTVTHPILATLTDELATQEIKDGKEQLEAMTGMTLDSFAYPNGKPGKDYLQGQTGLVARAGFQSAVSTQWGVATKKSDILQLPRFTPWDKSPGKFMLRLLRTYLLKS